MRRFFLLVGLFMAGALLAQNEATPAELEAGVDLAASALTALGMAINTGGVFLIVAWIVKKKPAFRKKYPHYIPIVAIVVGPFLNMVATLLGELVGVPIDFSPIAAAVAGPTAVAAHQFFKQRKKAEPSGKLPA